MFFPERRELIDLVGAANLDVLAANLDDLIANLDVLAPNLDVLAGRATRIVGRAANLDVLAAVGTGAGRASRIIVLDALAALGAGAGIDVLAANLVLWFDEDTGCLRCKRPHVTPMDDTSKLPLQDLIVTLELSDVLVEAADHADPTTLVYLGRPWHE